MFRPGRGMTDNHLQVCEPFTLRWSGHRVNLLLPMLQEAFLHFVWRTGRFRQQGLFTTNGESISVIRRGHYAGHAGPDFTGSRVSIDGTVWHGHVEMHLYASEWYRHRHQEDPAYDATILHVVWEEDRPVFRRDGTRLPCLELRRHVEPGLLARYHHLVADGNGIPCKYTLRDVPDITKRAMIDRAAAERLERKAQEVIAHLELLQGNWEETAWLCLAGGLGIPANSDPMHRLARSLPLSLLRRHAGAPLQLEALLFGMAGLLEEECNEEHPARLRQEFDFLRVKYGLQPMEASLWKFLRMRPSAFPTLRIARLAALAGCQDNLLANMLACANPREWIHSLEVPVHPYWTHHHRFGQVSTPSIKTLGRSAAEGLAINVLAPVLFAYGRVRAESKWTTKALDVWTALPAEENKAVAKWKAYGMPLLTALDSQGLLELQSKYCAPRRCVNCSIGCRIILEARQGVPVIAEEAVVGV